MFGGKWYKDRQTDFYFKMKLQILAMMLLVLSSEIATAHGFFLSKSFFGSQSDSKNAPVPSAQRSPNFRMPITNDNIFAENNNQQVYVPLQRDHQRRKPGNVQIINQSGSFHVPKSLCLACEKFPWMPVSGPEAKPESLRQESREIFSQNEGPSGTFIVNSLGRVPTIPSTDRKPLAISFGNDVSETKLQEIGKENYLTGPTELETIQGTKIAEISDHDNVVKSSEIDQQLLRGEKIKQFPPHGSFHPPVSPIFPLVSPMTAGTLIAINQNMKRPGTTRIQPANLVYQEHSQFHSPSMAHVINVPKHNIQHGNNPTHPVTNANFKIPILSSASGNFKINHFPPEIEQNHLQGNVHGQRMPSLIMMPPLPPNNLEQFGEPGHQSKENLSNSPANFIPVAKKVPHLQAMRIPQPPPMQIPLQFHANHDERVVVTNQVRPQRPVITPVVNKQPNVHDNTIRHLQHKPPRPTINILPIPVPTSLPKANKLEIAVDETRGHNQQALGNQRGHEIKQGKGIKGAGEWEIIPSVQTDLTHLYQKHKDQKKKLGGSIISGGPRIKTAPPITSPKKVPIKRPQFPVPMPLPIPIPNPEKAKAPLFIVSENNGIKESNKDQNIVVKDVSYHEQQSESSSPVKEANHQKAKPEWITSSLFKVGDSYHIKTPKLGPDGKQEIIKLPHKPKYIIRTNGQQPLPASILQALKHAQRTSFLTHQFHNAENNNRAKTVYVNSVSVGKKQKISNDQVQEPSKDLETVELTGKPVEHQSGKSGFTDAADDQDYVNCENDPEWVLPGTPSPIAPTTTPKPLLVYYPNVKPRFQSSSPPLYWLQSAHYGPTGVRYITRPAKVTKNRIPEPPNKIESEESSRNVVFSKPLQSGKEQDENSNESGIDGISEARHEEHAQHVNSHQIEEEKSSVKDGNIQAKDEHNDSDQGNKSSGKKEESSRNVKENHIVESKYEGENKSQGFQFYTLRRGPNFARINDALKTASTPLSVTPAGTQISKSTISSKPKGVSFSLQTFRFPTFSSDQLIVPSSSDKGSSGSSENSSPKQSWRAFYRTKIIPVTDKIKKEPDNFVSSDEETIADASNESPRFSRPLPDNLNRVAVPLSKDVSGSETLAECVSVTNELVPKDLSQASVAASAREEGLKGNVNGREKSTTEKYVPISTTDFIPSKLKEISDERIQSIRVGARFPGMRPKIGSIKTTQSSRDNLFQGSNVATVYKPLRSEFHMQEKVREEVDNLSSTPSDEALIGHHPPSNILSVSLDKEDENEEGAGHDGKERPNGNRNVKVVTSTKKSSSYSVSSMSKSKPDAHREREGHRVAVSRVNYVNSHRSNSPVTSNLGRRWHPSPQVHRSGSTGNVNGVVSSLNRKAVPALTEPIENGEIMRKEQEEISNEYINSFPELTTQQKDSLNEEEKSQVKSAMIELQKSTSF